MIYTRALTIMEGYNEPGKRKHVVYLQFYHPLAIVQLVCIFSGQEDGLAGPYRRQNDRKH